MNGSVTQAYPCLPRLIVLQFLEVNRFVCGIKSSTNMDIIRSRLFDSDCLSGENYYHKMAKTRSKGDIDIQPCRAKRKLFEEPLSANRTGETVRNLRRKVEGSPVDQRFTDIEVFENAPHPYRPVTHTARSFARLDPSQDQMIGETKICERVASSSNTVSERSGSPRTGQTHLQDYFKPKKRPRLSDQHPKTPVTRQTKTQCIKEERVTPSGGGM